MEDIICDIVDYIGGKFYFTPTVFFVAKKYLTDLPVLVDLEDLKGPED